MDKGENIINIAIDGPAGSGKSTAAKNVAEKLGIEYIDTGAMYRAVAYKAIRTGIPLDDEKKVADMLAGTEIDYAGGKVYLDGKDISGSIRQLQISQAASRISQLRCCREKLAELQRAIGRSRSIVMDGRDIGTNVLPDAKYKFFLTASAQRRAERRYAEMQEKGSDVTFEDVMADIVERDRKDTTRKLNPLVRADDAIEINTDDIDIQQTTDRLLSYIKK